jgi:hypothetical protein
MVQQLAHRNECHDQIPRKLKKRCQKKAGYGRKAVQRKGCLDGRNREVTEPFILTAA